MKGVIKPLMETVPIGALASTEVFKLVSGLKNCNNLFSEETNLQIDNFRMMYSDGNGFYRVAMFSFLEINILMKRVDNLRKFAYDFSNVISKPLKGRNIQINKNEFLAIIYIIIELVDKGELEQAYFYFIKAYFLFESFDLVRF